MREDPSPQGHYGSEGPDSWIPIAGPSSLRPRADDQ